MRRWKFEKPQEGQVQSPGLGRFLDGGKGVKISAARSRTRLDEGETSMAFSFKARPFIQRLSAAYHLMSGSCSRKQREKLKSTYLLVGRENGKARASGLVLIRRPESPESDWTTAKLGEPAFQFRLCSVVGQAAQMEDLAALCQKGTNIRSGIHGSSQDFRVLVWRLRLANQAAENASQSDGLLHCPARRGGGQCLKVEREVMFDRSGGLDRFNFKRSTDIGKRAGTERERLRVVGLPSLVLGAEVKGPGVLKIRGKDDSLVTSLTGQLHSEIPRIQRYKGELEILADEVFLGKSIEAVDCVTEGTCRADVFPCQSCKACCQTLSAIEPTD